jgi:hypothetical protein
LIRVGRLLRCGRDLRRHGRTIFPFPELSLIPFDSRQRHVSLNTPLGGVRIVVFLQEHGQGRIVGVQILPVLES